MKDRHMMAASKAAADSLRLALQRMENACELAGDDCVGVPNLSLHTRVYWNKREMMIHAVTRAKVTLSVIAGASVNPYEESNGEPRKAYRVEKLPVATE